MNKGVRITLMDSDSSNITYLDKSPNRSGPQFPRL